MLLGGLELRPDLPARVEAPDEELSNRAATPAMTERKCWRTTWWEYGSAEHVKYPDFGVVEVRYYHGIALEIERHPCRAPVVGGVYVFAMGRFPRLGPLAAAPSIAVLR